jgi:hypothetical protein
MSKKIVTVTVKVAVADEAKLAEAASESWPDRSHEWSLEDRVTECLLNAPIGKMGFCDCGFEVMEFDSRVEHRAEQEAE